MAKGKKTGGRQLGTKNKVKKPMRDKIVEFSLETFDEFVTAFRRIDEPDRKCKIWIDLLGYGTPKLSSVEMRENGSGKTFAEELEEISRERE